MTPDRPDVFSWILEEFEATPKTTQAEMNLEADAYLIVVAGR
jgi:cytochrome P450 family 628